MNRAFFFFLDSIKRLKYHKPTKLSNSNINLQCIWSFSSSSSSPTWLLRVRWSSRQEEVAHYFFFFAAIFTVCPPNRNHYQPFSLTFLSPNDDVSSLLRLKIRPTILKGRLAAIFSTSSKVKTNKECSFWHSGSLGPEWTVAHFLIACSIPMVIVSASEVGSIRLSNTSTTITITESMEKSGPQPQSRPFGEMPMMGPRRSSLPLYMRTLLVKQLQWSLPDFYYETS